jgi:hypothetical protein
MELIRLQSVFNGMKFVIEQSLPSIGYYLYIYSGDKCIYDYLQDSVEMCKEFALEDFNVPLNSWEVLPSRYIVS